MLRPLRLLSHRTSLAVKLGFLLGVVVALALTALLALQRVQRHAMTHLLNSEIRERSSILRQTIVLASRPLRDMSSDYAQWDDMVTFVREPKQAWAAINLDASLEKFDVSGLWVLRVDGSLVYSTLGEDKPASPPLPLPTASLQAILAQPPEDTFFAKLPDRVVELCLSPVQPSADTQRITRPLGWVLAEKTWDAAHLKLLSEMTQSTGQIVAAGQPLPATAEHEFALRHPLPGPDGKPVADFVYVIRAEELAIASQQSQTVFIVFGLCGLVIATLAIVTLYRWVLRPLSAVAESLARNDLVPIAPLARRSDEMGRLARLVETSFAQRAELQRNLAERTRLSRELHDGAIQTVYAAGMSLGGVRSCLRSDPAAAEAAVDSIRDALNSTIRDLRTFIDGLDPEPSRATRFGEAVRSILTLLQGVRPITFSLEIDDALADRLPTNVRLHLLQIIRETASNSARHSQARTLRIVLRRELQLISLEISDDGVGLAAPAESAQGRGLANLAERTRELGGNLRFESTPGRGLRVQLTFPNPAVTSA